MKSKVVLRLKFIWWSSSICSSFRIEVSPIRELSVPTAPKAKLVCMCVCECAGAFSFCFSEAGPQGWSLWAAGWEVLANMASVHWQWPTADKRWTGRACAIFSSSVAREVVERDYYTITILYICSWLKITIINTTLLLVNQPKLKPMCSVFEWNDNPGQHWVNAGTQWVPKMIPYKNLLHSVRLVYHQLMTMEISLLQIILVFQCGSK